MTRILIVFRTGWALLRRDRVALAVTFLLPMLFFSIFVWMFSGGGGGGTSRIKLAVADEDAGVAGQRLIDELARDSSFRLIRADPDQPDAPLTREGARAMVEDGEVSVALVIPRGFSDGFGGFASGDDDTVALELYADTADPIAPQMTGGVLQGAAMRAAPDLMIERGMGQLERWAGPMTAKQRDVIDRWLPQVRADSRASADRADADADDARAARDGPGVGGLVRVTIIDVLGAEKDRSPVTAFYAAGTAVMFLLFSVTSAGGSLLEEQENGVLERLLGSRLTMAELLLGKWLFLSSLGALQIVVMFVWGALVFELELFTPGHLVGFAIMTVFTSLAAAGFGLVLAAACRTRAQLGGISTIVILGMSALGGSMFPRFLMPETMKTLGYLTFNAWALDGYQKVFWFDKRPLELWPQVAVLGALALTFMIGARLLARRWEAA
ncbi:MAG: ABC transporter permease [Myxococcales bacterium]|nr:ABC transporter permease [Myxococcales bacterium]